MRPAAPICLALLVAACDPFPDLDTGSDDAARAPYPTLVPLTGLLAGIGPNAPPPEADAQQIEEELTARVEALRARAATLRQSALTPAERRELEDALDRRGG